MSLFGSLMGDFEEDPFFGAHMRTMRQMNNMMNSMFADPFGFMDSMGPPALTGPHSRALAPMGGRRPGGDLMPFGFMNMNRIFPDFDQLGNDPNCHSFSSSTVMTMTSGPDGRPQVYQASSSTRTAPGGVKEVKKTVCDSRTGVKKMAIGHHIGERGHVLEREQNLHSGDKEERQEFINLDEEEAVDFNKEFEEKTRRSAGAISYNVGSRHAPGQRRERETMRALPPATNTSSSRVRSRGNIEHRRRNYPSLPAPSSSVSDSTLSDASTVVLPASPSHTMGGQERARKRGHEPEGEQSHKALKPDHETQM
ncbi:hypothetical protein R5R35_010029 [Gryllus longicercus]|uniref:Myeloid leukemia factor n=1 Tax=Gryllus longicercus TaxID=2509291 RepID=A0AAN9ZBG0_9ORTH